MISRVARPVRIFQVCHNPICVRNYVMPIIARLGSAGMECHLVTEDSPAVKSFAEELGSRLHLASVELRGAPLHALSQVRSVWRLVRVHDPDVIYCHQTRGSTIALLVGLLCGVPIRVYHNHGLPYLGYTGFLRFALWLLECLNSLLATHVLYVSRSNAEDAAASCVPKASSATILASGSFAGFPVERIPSPDKHAGLRRSLRSSIGISDRTVVVAYVGRPHRRKGFHAMLEAWGRMPADEDVHLIIAGCTKEDCIRAHGTVPVRVTALGNLDDLSEFYASADVVALPSLHEGFPNALLEGAAFGSALLGSDVSGVRCAIENGKTGFLVATGSVDALVEALMHLVQDGPGRRRMGALAQERVKKEFSQERLLAEFEAFCLALVRQRGHFSSATDLTGAQ